MSNMQNAEHDLKGIMYPAYGTHHRLRTIRGNKSSKPRIHLNDNTGSTGNKFRCCMTIMDVKFLSTGGCAKAI